MLTQTVRQFNKVCEILDKYDHNPAKLIPILQEVQTEYRYLPEKVLVFIATSLGISPAHIYGVATFYAHFALAPKGKYIINVCDGTACHVKGSMKMVDAIAKHLGLSGDAHTTPDLMFTLETVSCLGACGLAPVIVINNRVYGQVTPEKCIEAINEIIADEKKGAAQ